MLLLFLLLFLLLEIDSVRINQSIFAEDLEKDSTEDADYGLVFISKKIVKKKNKEMKKSKEG